MSIQIQVTKQPFAWTTKYKIDAEFNGRRLYVDMKCDNEMQLESIEYLLTHIRKMIEHEMGHHKNGKLD